MSHSPYLEIVNLSKAFAGRPVVSELSLSINRGELLSLLGPSGCGKTTTLRLIGGFLAPDAGQILLDGEPIHTIPPENRPVCTVFQSYALFPHMTALENVMYGLRCAGRSRQAARKEAVEMLDVVGLSDLANLGVTRMSGGQQQRVALARVLVLHPKVLLLDEPFSNLDASLRLQMREEVRALQHRLNLTTIFVTHDREEAMALSDRVAVMQDGRIAQVGVPRQIYTEPVSHYVAECLGHVNTIRHDGRVLHFRPESVVLHKNDGGYRGEILSVSYLGHLTRFLIGYRDDRITVDLVTGSGQVFLPGERVGFSISKQLCYDDENRQPLSLA